MKDLFTILAPSIVGWLMYLWIGMFFDAIRKTDLRTPLTRILDSVFYATYSGVGVKIDDAMFMEGIYAAIGCGLLVLFLIGPPLGIWALGQYLIGRPVDILIGFGGILVAAQALAIVVIAAKRRGGGLERTR